MVVSEEQPPAVEGDAAASKKAAKKAAKAAEKQQKKAEHKVVYLFCRTLQEFIWTNYSLAV